MATSFTTHSAGQVIASADINLIQTAVNTLENAAGTSTTVRTYDPGWNGQTTSSSNAFKGCLFTPSTNQTVVETTAQLSGITASAVFKAMVVILASNSVGATTISSVVGSSDPVALSASAAGAPGKLHFKWSTPPALTAGTTYAMLVGCTNNSGTYVMPIVPSQGCGGTLALATVPGTLGATVVCAVASPIATSVVTVSASTDSRFAPGFTVTVP